MQHPSLSPLTLTSPASLAHLSPPDQHLLLRHQAGCEAIPHTGITTPNYHSPTNLQHFSFNNLENIPPSLGTMPGTMGTLPMVGPRSCTPMSPCFSSPSWSLRGTEPPEFPAEKRLVVNARQRSRVQNMNDAFRQLKGKVPGLGDEDKTFSKLEVLQCTIAYMKHLYTVLGMDPQSLQSDQQNLERLNQLERRFVQHGGNIKKRGSKRRADGSFSSQPY